LTDRGILSGIKVLDLTRMLSGPYCTMVLADHGAEVIKIEDSKGDTSRFSGPYKKYDSDKEWAGYFVSLNRNKKSIQIDLKSTSGIKKFRRLVCSADVLVENFRPGVMEKLGLSFEELNKLNPKLVYGAIRGFGDPRSGESPYNDWPSYDVVAQAMGGLISLTGPDPNTVTKVGPGVGDIFTGLYLSFGIIAAVREAESSGLGQFIDISMYDAMISLCERAVYQYDFEGRIPTASGNGHPFLAPFGIFPAKDGNVAIGVVEDSFWKRLVKAIGSPEYENHSDFSTIMSRKKNILRVNKLVETWTSGLTKLELLKKLGGKVPFGPVNNVQDIFNDPHTECRKMIEKIKDPYEANESWCVAANPLKFSRSKKVALETPPRLGEHTADYLGQDKIGLEKKIDGLALRKAFGTFTTGVTIATTLQKDRIPRGFTANSFSSVSLEPPLLLVCLSKGGLSYKTFTESTYFAINVLSEDQKELSALFATQSEEKFTSTIWSHGHKDVPILKGCLSSFVCKNEKIIDAGDHTVLIGRVEQFSTNEGRPLLYYKGQYVSPESGS
jgi:crotonobetainyl-CoA:carnitine CoA-transferase CaiB-like acyl-CoA transferase/flavin reductase (DIM6/NTAB) family NADH-FMN oxidoreductase RutF